MQVHKLPALGGCSTLGSSRGYCLEMNHTAWSCGRGRRLYARRFTSVSQSICPLGVWRVRCAKLRRVPYNVAREPLCLTLLLCRGAPGQDVETFWQEEVKVH